MSTVPPQRGTLRLCLITLLSVTENSFLCSSLTDDGDKQPQSPWARIIWFKKENKKSHAVSYVRPAFSTGP